MSACITNFDRGMNQSGLMKLKGAVQGKKTTIWIDSRATYNFLCYRISEKLHIVGYMSMLFKIFMGNCQSAKGQCDSKGQSSLRLPMDIY